jgi:hypothetical protein
VAGFFIQMAYCDMVHPVDHGSPMESSGDFILTQVFAMKMICCCKVFIVGFMAISQVVLAESAVPEPFQGFDEASKYVIKYDDLTALLRTVVVDVGRSTREVAKPSQAKTGTIMKSKIKRTTADEANRFYFETFQDNEAARQLLSTIRDSLEQLPTEVSLEYFSRDEQLAYWLNLYNVTLLNELVDIFPKRNLQKILVGKKSILSKQLLNVAGVPLSLDDIQFTILKNNYDNNPLVIYGLYQGIIGGPNIRKSAYTGNDVWRALKNNATEFINSNRGTYSIGDNSDVFEVSSLYDRNRSYFPSFDTDLSAHLLEYLEGYERKMLTNANTLKPGINDWTITSLSGNYREFGGSIANNSAALLDSVSSTVVSHNEGSGAATLGASVGYGSSSVASKALAVNRIDPDLLEHLIEINEKRLSTNAINSSVTVEELGEFPVNAKEETVDDKKD